MDLLSPLSESAFKGRRHTSLRDDRVSFELTAEDIAHVARLTSGHSSRNLPLDLPALAEEEDWKVRNVCREEVGSLSRELDQLLPNPLSTGTSLTHSFLLQDTHPSALTQFQSFTKKIHGKRLAVFLDYDGRHADVRPSIFTPASYGTLFRLACILCQSYLSLQAHSRPSSPTPIRHSCPKRWVRQQCIKQP